MSCHLGRGLMWATEAMGAGREHLIAAVNFVVNVKSGLGYILTHADVAARGIFFCLLCFVTFLI